MVLLVLIYLKLKFQRFLNMNKKNKFEIIKKILEKNFKIKKIQLETDLTKLREWDSLKHLEFTMLIEKKFKKKLQIRNLFNLKKIKDFLSELEIN